MRTRNRTLLTSLVLLGAGACSDATAPTRPAAPGEPRFAGVSGAAFTTINSSVDAVGGVTVNDLCKNGNPNNNCNIYGSKDYVWLNGGPDAAYVGDGTYFFAVLTPGGQADPNDGADKNLSDGANGSYQTRTFTVSDNGATVTYAKPPGTHDVSGKNIRLMPYDDTGNPGGVYIMAICSLADGYPVTPSKCKYDAFKIRAGASAVPDAPLVVKDANGAYKNTYTWGITKAVDKTKVEAYNGNATFTYTVAVTHNSGAISNVTLGGTITVTNPNAAAIANVKVTDQLSDPAISCSVTDGATATLQPGSNTFAYTCNLSDRTQVPAGLSNTAKVEWPEQDVGSAGKLPGGSESFTIAVSFDGTTVDGSVNVTDAFNGGAPVTLGTVKATDASPTYLPSYSQTVPIPATGCTAYTNTAQFVQAVGITTGLKGSDSKTVQACRIPRATGARTIGFWQNKNGQGIISGGAATSSGVCNSGTWLRQYAPYQDLSTTASCSAVAKYVYDVIKAASSAGLTMNPMLKAQMLASALDVYFSDPALGGNKLGAPAALGAVTIDMTVVCKMFDGSGGVATCSNSYQNVSSAFGGATSLTVSQMLSYAASQSDSGGVTWYGQVKATQEMAKNAFDAINNQVAYTP